jgi:hypothetical protein
MPVTNIVVNQRLAIKGETLSLLLGETLSLLLLFSKSMPVTNIVVNQRLAIKGETRTGGFDCAKKHKGHSLAPPVA